MSNMLDVISGQVYDIYDTTSQDYIYNRVPFLGQKVAFADGREYRFVSTAVDITAGQVVSAPVPTVEIDGAFTAAAAGATTVKVTSATIGSATKDLYADGFLVITETSGLKHSYKIKGNTAAATNAVTFTLEYPLLAAVATGDACFVVPFKYSNTIVGIAASNPVGVAIRTVTPATDGTTAFMWVQTKGTGGVLLGTEAGATIGVTLKSSDAGVAEIATAGTPVIGTSLAAAAVANGDMCPVDLCIC